MQVSSYHHHWLLHPNVYIAPKINKPFKIDGDLEKDEWASVPWSNTFDDIRGQGDAPESSRPTPKQTTRIKMVWDDDFLYIGAMIESDFEVRATYQERNSPIYHEDSDFEVFVDPDASCHFYKELEMNAINTVWNLMLDKPYADGGQELSGRIAKPGDDNYYDVVHQETAVRVVEGSLNNENGDQQEERTVWTVEIALAHSDTLKRKGKDGLWKAKPKEGDRWRINFSRVEKKGSINWTWQRQRVWDPQQRTHVGKVDMHMPDAWGYVKFGPTAEDAVKENIMIGEVPSEQLVKGSADAVDPNWPLLLAAMNVYYAQRSYLDLHGTYATTIENLKEFLDEMLVAPFVGKIDLLTSSSSYVTKVRESGGRTVTVDDSRLTTLLKRSEFSNGAETKIN